MRPKVNWNWELHTHLDGNLDRKFTFCLPLTKFYVDILELRRLHGQMDSAVLRAYGWDDLAESARCEFLLDYEEDEDDESPATGKRSRKKKPWRYRWPDDFRDEVLARLLELNEQRHKEDLLGVTGKVDSKEKPAPKKAKRSKKTNAVETPLFDDE